MTEAMTHDMTQTMTENDAQTGSRTVQRPAWLPEKFWDAESGTPRYEALAKSYAELERKLHGGRGYILVDHDGDPMTPEIRAYLGVPERPEDYPLEMAHPALEPDEEINAEMVRLGFTPEQAQFVYDLAATRVMPVIENMDAENAREARRAALARHFGGEAKFDEIARQVTAWGRANLPEELFETLSASPDGVIAMHAMMRSGEPRFLDGRAGPEGPLDEAALKKLVDDPRYWRDHDPELVRQVQDGFKRLYPE